MKRFVLNMNTGKWHFVLPPDKNYDTGLTGQEMLELGIEKAKEKYLAALKGETRKP